MSIYRAYMLLLTILYLLATVQITHTQSTTDTQPNVIDISAQIQQQQQHDHDHDHSHDADVSVTVRRLRALTQHNIGIGSLNGQPITVVEDINPDIDNNEVKQYGHLHKSAHLHQNADGSTFLHVQTVEHDHLQPHTQANHIAAANEPQLQSLNADEILQQLVDDDNDVIIHGSHTHKRSEVNRNSGYIMLALIVIFGLSQAGIYLWKQYHAQSYNISAILGTWLIPLLYTTYHHYHNHLFVLLWTIYTAITAYCIYVTRLNKHVNKYTPRIIYGSTFVIFHLCYTITAIGLISLLLDVLGISLIITYWTNLDIFPLIQFTIYPLIYALYFGVLNSDTANYVTQRLAHNLGYTPTKNSRSMANKQLPIDRCALCDGTLYDTIEPTYTLHCSHTFHSMCLKGHSLIGKRDTCPYCYEKIDLNQFIDQPWLKPTVWYSMLLSVVRYLIVFNPMIFILANWILLIVY